MSHLAPQGSKGTSVTVPSLHPFLDPSFVFRFYGIYTSFTHKALVTSYVISSRRPCCRTSLRGTNVSRTKRKKKAKIYGFPTARKSFRQAREVAEGRLKREEDEAEKVGMVGRHSCTIYGGECRIDMEYCITETQKSGVFKTL